MRGEREGSSSASIELSSVSGKHMGREAGAVTACVQDVAARSGNGVTAATRGWANNAVLPLLHWQPCARTPMDVAIFPCPRMGGWDANVSFTDESAVLAGT